MFEKHKTKEGKVSNKTNELQEWERKRHFLCFRNLKLYSTCLNDKACAIIIPNCLKLLHLMLIFHLSTACVKRFFSKIKLVKTWPRNQLLQVNLENLLFIATEAPKTGFNNSKYDFFVDELKKIIWELMFEALFTTISLPDIMYPVT